MAIKDRNRSIPGVAQKDKLTQIGDRLCYLVGVVDLAAAAVHEDSVIGDAALSAVLNGLHEQLYEVFTWVVAARDGDVA